MNPFPPVEMDSRFEEQACPTGLAPADAANDLRCVWVELILEEQLTVVEDLVGHNGLHNSCIDKRDNVSIVCKAFR